MKVSKTHAYTTPGACALLVTPDESERLYRLPLWAFRLFTSLILCADFKTGHGQTGYPELLALLTPDQPERGPRHWVPSRDDVKNMLRRFVEVGLLARDRAASEARGNIIFHIQPRVWQSVSAEIATRKLTRGASARNPDEHRAKRTRRGKTYPETYPHLQDSFSINSLPSNVDNLSTGEAEAPSPAQGEKLTPQRGLNVAPAGHAPPPEALTGSGAGHGEGSHQGPPGGREGALAGHAPGELCEQERAVLAREQAAEVARQRAEWKAQRAHQPDTVRVDDPETWQRDEQGRVILPVDHPTNRAIRHGPGLRRFSWS